LVFCLKCWIRIRRRRRTPEVVKNCNNFNRIPFTAFVKAFIVEATGLRREHPALKKSNLSSFSVRHFWIRINWTQGNPDPEGAEKLKIYFIF
jgi:hypothetical protein